MDPWTADKNSSPMKRFVTLGCRLLLYYIYDPNITTTNYTTYHIMFIQAEENVSEYAAGSKIILLRVLLYICQLM